MSASLSSAFICGRFKIHFLDQLSIPVHQSISSASSRPRGAVARGYILRAACGVTALRAWNVRSYTLGSSCTLYDKHVHTGRGRIRRAALSGDICCTNRIPLSSALRLWIVTMIRYDTYRDTFDPIHDTYRRYVSVQIYDVTRYIFDKLLPCTTAWLRYCTLVLYRVDDVYLYQLKNTGFIPDCFGAV